MRILFLFFLLTACQASKYPFGQKSFKGIVKTCILDSTSFTIEKNVCVLNAKTFINSNCPNKPSSYEYPMSWPSMLSIDFESKKYLFGHSGEPVDNSLEFKDPKFRYNLRADIGTLKYNKKLNVLKFTSDRLNWTREFKVLHLDKDSLVLEAINGY